MTGRRFGLALELDASSGEALFIQIARALSTDIRRGRLRPGEKLPGSRSLAAELAVHRNTVVAAYAELAAEGWLETDEARGSFVSRALPEVAPRRFAKQRERARTPGFDFEPDAPAIEPEPAPKTLVLSTGVPDVRLAPVDELARALRRALRQEAVRVLSYGHERGHPRLTAALAEMLSSTRGLALGPDELLVTRGSQMALYLIARALIRPGDHVGVEALGYRPAWDVLRARGAELVPFPVDASGIDVDAVASLCRRRRLRALYVTPHHQYPTLATLTAPRRVALLELAAKHRFAIIEDDYDHEFHYEGRPVLPLASADGAGVVLYVGTLSKILAPGLRVGWVVAPPPLLAALAGLRSTLDSQGDLVIEAALAELMEDGVLERHAKKARNVYRARRDRLVSLLESELGGELSFRVPSGGMALWAKCERRDADAWAEAAASQGLVLHGARRFAFDGRSRPYLRLGYASLDERELGEAVRRLVRSRPVASRKRLR